MKKVVGILVNDVHLNKGNGELVKDIFRQIISLCKQLKCDNILCGGDVFTNRSGQPLSCLMDWKEIVDRIRDNSLNLHIIPGNHDKTDPDDLKSYLDVYTDRCVHLYRQGSVFHPFRTNIAFTFIPYFTDDVWLLEYERAEDIYKAMLADGDVNDATKRVLITHSGFDGVRNNDGTVVSSVIKPSMFKDWDMVLIGHYHNASELRENVIYTGSAYQNDYGESIDDKGFTVIYDDATTMPVPSVFPKYIKRTLKAGDKEELRKLLELYKNNTTDHIRFVFTGRKEDCQKVNATELESKYGIDCKFVSTEEKEAIDISEDDSVLCYDSKMIQREYFKYCSENNIKGEKMKYGLNLIKNM